MVAYNNLFEYYILYCASLDDTETLYKRMIWVFQCPFGVNKDY